MKGSNIMESALSVYGGHTCGPAAAAAEVVVVPQSFPAPASLVVGGTHVTHDHASGVLWGHRRAFIGHAATAGFMAAAVGFTVRRGRTLGFRKLFHSVSAPKDVVYIGFLYGLGDVSQQLITQTRK